MDTEQELGRMIDELTRRTGNDPARIICSQATLNRLWEQSSALYSSVADMENNTGYVARYHGIPIMTSPGIEDGSFLLIPEEGQDRPVQAVYTPATTGTMHFAGTLMEDPTTIEEGYHNGDIVQYNDTQYIWTEGGFSAIEPEHITTEPSPWYGTFVSDRSDHWWSRSPFSTTYDWQTSPWRTFTGTFTGTSPENPTDTEADVDINGHLFDRVLGGRNLERAIKEAAKKRKKKEEESVDIDEASFVSILQGGNGNVST